MKFMKSSHAHNVVFRQFSQFLPSEVTVFVFCFVRLWDAFFREGKLCKDWIGSSEINFMNILLFNQTQLLYLQPLVLNDELIKILIGSWPIREKFSPNNVMILLDQVLKRNINTSLLLFTSFYTKQL
jgi:hypothetical protein